jgi:hypothetical protein
MKSFLRILVIALVAFPANAWQSPDSSCAQVMVPAGTEIPLILTQAIDPRTSKTGDHVTFMLLDDFSVAGCILAAKGTSSVAPIAALTRPRSLGRAGKVELRFKTLQTVDGQHLWLDAERDGDVVQSAANPARGIALPTTLVQFILHGSHATVPRGTMASVTVARTAQIHGQPAADPGAAGSADPEAPATVIIFQSPEELVPGQEHLFSGGVYLSCFERGRYFKGELAAGNYRFGKSKVPLQLIPASVRYFRVYNEAAGAIEEASAGEFEFFSPELQPLTEKCSQNILRHAFRPIKPKPKK